MVGLLGRKVGMTQIFDDEGRQIPVTVLEVGPCFVTDLRTKEKDGYLAVQLGFDRAKEKSLNKPKMGHLKKASCPPLRFMGEIRTDEVEGLKVGQEVKVDNFVAGDYIDIEGISIGRGFQGVVKRHHFKGAATKSHGDMHGRRPGSIGQSSYPSRVFKGMKGPGHMGAGCVTVQNLKVVKIDAEKNTLVVRGAVPGFDNGYLVIRQALKRGVPRKWKVEGSSSQAPKETQKLSPGEEQEKGSSGEAQASQESKSEKIPKQET